MGRPAPAPHGGSSLIHPTARLSREALILPRAEHAMLAATPPGATYAHSRRATLPGATASGGRGVQLPGTTATLPPTSREVAPPRGGGASTTSTRTASRASSQRYVRGSPFFRPHISRFRENQMDLSRLIGAAVRHVASSSCLRAPLPTQRSKQPANRKPSSTPGCYFPPNPHAAPLPPGLQAWPTCLSSTNPLSAGLSDSCCDCVTDPPSLFHHNPPVVIVFTSQT
ncbi:hypothetical protein AAFF_G00235650 [Aldrovandia affinis]|uniref:Uncharacterized protein n=1 Tax=Aldrovandia affinis TaxID=143900 RepID=A0AAD7SV36_9TELE|nr:hypothetical protein AAFF_G00235650 [Aldrovandia affinis]